MVRRSVEAMVVLAILAACGADTPAPPGDGPRDAMRSVLCAREGASSVTGAGPAGSLDASHVYAQALSGFCSEKLLLIVTTDDPLATPYLGGSGMIYAPVPELGGTAEWSGTLAATISLPDGSATASGTLQVDQATPGFGAGPTRLRATARFDDGDWHFTATIDAPYCIATVCL